MSKPGGDQSEMDKKKEATHDYMEHAWPVEELERKLGVSLNKAVLQKSAGLSKDEAARRLEANGPNALTPPKVTPWWLRLLMKFVDPFMLLLQLAAVLCFVLYILTMDIVNMWIALVLVFVVILTCLLSYLQEGQSAKVMASFKTMMSDTARVRRGGVEMEVDAKTLVVGDIVLVEGGQKVPADIRMLLSDGLKVENSSFTGEPEPIELVTEKTDDEALHSKNMAFSSAPIIEGRGVGIVVRTGDHTMIGSIASLVGQTSEGKSTLEVEVVGFVHFITVLAIVSAILLYVVALAKGQDPLKSFITVFIVIVIANVPEGLPATVTSCLTVSAKTLAEKHVFIKRLDCVETLGSTTVIASDKTGTLTKNQMTVSRMWFDGRVRMADQLRREPDWASKATFQELITTGALCNMCKFEDGPVVAQEPQKDLRDFHLISGTQANVNQFTVSRRRRAEGANADGSVQLTYAGVSIAAPKPSMESIFDAAVSDEMKDGTAQSTTANKAANQLTIGRSQGVQMTIGKQQGNQMTVGRFGGLERQNSALKTFGVPTANRKILGNPSDKAIFTFCNDFKPIEETRFENPQVYIIPFNSSLKWMKTIHAPHRSNPDQRRVCILKGAPERVLASCSTYMLNGVERPIDEEFNQRFEEVYKEIAGQGERVLGFARRKLSLDKFPPSVDGMYKELEKDIPHEEFTFVGLISLIDPPKDGVPEAVATCKGAGIRVIMITGDHPLTAEAIAKQVNIIGDFDLRETIAKERGIDPKDVEEDVIGAAVVPCHELANYTEPMWQTLLDKPELVFARASPQDKLTIVKHLRERGEVVAVTGDGVNDSPALKNADIGIAMGIMGSAVAQSAANVILMDDNFCSIVRGIEEGRNLFDNLTKTIAYTLTHLVPELVAVIINIVADLPYGMSSLMILSIDLLSEVPPAISFAWEKSESNLMQRPPRNRKVDKLVKPTLLAYSYLQAGLIEAGVCLLAYFLVYQKYGVPIADLPALNAAFNSKADSLTLSTGVTLNSDQIVIYVDSAMTSWYVTLVLSQAVHAFVCKTRFMPMLQHGVFENPLMNFGVMAEIGILVFVVFVPGVNMIFYSNSREEFVFFLPFLISGFLLIVWAEFRKWMIRSYPDSLFARMFCW